MKLSTAALLACCFSSSIIPACLTQTAHYPNGVEGLKAASLPPSGLYLRDYNYCYFADRFPGGPADFDATVYVQAPRLIWMSEYKPLGATYGADFLIPWVYQDIKVGAAHQRRFGLGDMLVEPLLLSWNQERYDVALAYGFWAPTGDFEAGRLTNPGKGYFGHMLTAGASLHLDAEKSWSISALNRFEINHENPDTDTTTGAAWTIEGGLSRSLGKTADIGVVGYVQAKLGKDSGPAAGVRDSIAGLGPEVNVLIPGINVFASARYIFEFAASDRPEGQLLNVTLTKRF